MAKLAMRVCGDVCGGGCMRSLFVVGCAECVGRDGGCGRFEFLQMFNALNTGCVLGGEGSLIVDCDVGGDECLGGVCDDVADICVVIGGVMGFCCDMVSMSRLNCDFFLYVSGGVLVEMVVLCCVGYEVTLVCSVLC